MSGRRTDLEEFEDILATFPLTSEVLEEWRTRCERLLEKAQNPLPRGHADLTLPYSDWMLLQDFTMALKVLSDAVWKIEQSDDDIPF